MKMNENVRTLKKFNEICRFFFLIFLQKQGVFTYVLKKTRTESKSKRAQCDTTFRARAKRLKFRILYHYKIFKVLKKFKKPHQFALISETDRAKRTKFGDHM